MREIRTLRAMWRVLETEPRQFLTGHEEGNLGYMPRKSLRATAPVPDPTAVASDLRSGWPSVARCPDWCAPQNPYPESEKCLVTFCGSLIAEHFNAYCHD